jgi:hypothetical protein
VRRVSTGINLLVDHRCAFSSVYNRRLEGRYSTTSENDLYEITQDPVSTGWRITLIEYLAANGAILESYFCYNTVVTAYDSNGVAQPGCQAAVYADQPVTLNINGETCFLDAG